MIDSGKTISNSHALLIKIYIQETEPILLIFRSTYQKYEYTGKEYYRKFQNNQITPLCFSTIQKCE